MSDRPELSNVTLLDGKTYYFEDDVARLGIGAPLKATTVAEMTDTSKVYVYVGNETGYNNGHWYYYNGTTWTDGGVYNAVAVQTDPTLTIPDTPADAWATGKAIGGLKSKIDASGAIYQDNRIVIGSGGTVGDSAVNSIILLSGDPAQEEFVEILAPNSLMIGAYKTGSRPAQIQIGARATPSANALGRNPWLADYTDSDGVFRSETDGLDVIAIGSAKAITRTNSPAIAFGTMVVARGGSSIAIGQQSLASGSFSVAVGVGLLSTQQDQVVLGRWNKDEQGDVFQIGNGTASGTTATRTNAFRVTRTGHVIAQNAIGIEDGQGGVVEISAAELQALKNLLS